MLLFFELFLLYDWHDTFCLSVYRSRTPLQTSVSEGSCWRCRRRVAMATSSGREWADSHRAILSQCLLLQQVCLCVRRCVTTIIRQQPWLVGKGGNCNLGDKDLTLWRPLLPYGYSYKASCARLGQAVICNFRHPGTLTLRAERKSARMSKITNDCLCRSGTGCFIAVPIWQQWASKG